MPANGYNVGRDVTVDVITSTGPLRATIRTGFTSKQETTQLQSKGADGTNRFSEIPEGWSGALDYDRADGIIDNYFAQTEADYYNGIAPAPITITETIGNVDGSISQYRYTGVVLKYEDAGNKQSDQIVKLKVAWRCARRVRVI